MAELTSSDMTGDIDWRATILACLSTIKLVEAYRELPGEILQTLMWIKNKRSLVRIRCQVRPEGRITRTWRMIKRLTRWHGILNEWAYCCSKVLLEYQIRMHMYRTTGTYLDGLVLMRGLQVARFIWLICKPLRLNAQHGFHEHTRGGGLPRSVHWVFGERPDHLAEAA
jgi:hypothetical protein